MNRNRFPVYAGMLALASLPVWDDVATSTAHAEPIGIRGEVERLTPSIALVDFLIDFDRPFDVTRDGFSYYFGLNPNIPQLLARPEYEFRYAGGADVVVRLYGTGPPNPGVVVANLPIAVDRNYVSFSFSLATPPGFGIGAYFALVTTENGVRSPAPPLLGRLGTGLVVPEPSSVVMAGVGGVGLVGAAALSHRRRRHPS